MKKLICHVTARFAVALVCLASGLSLAQSNYQQQQQWQRQQEMQRQQDMQRQQMQQQQRQQMQEQQRQQMQEQQRRQMQEQQRQQMQSQQRQQMQTQQRQQTADQQRQQMQRQGALTKDGKPTGVVVSGGTARMTRPLTPGEIQKGFTGRVTADGRALIKYQGRIFTVPASRVAGLSARLAKQRADRQAASAQSASTTQRLGAIAAAGGGSGREPPTNNLPGAVRGQPLGSVSPVAVAARLEAAQLARVQERGFKDDSVGAMRTPPSSVNRTIGAVKLTKDNFSVRGTMESDPKVFVRAEVHPGGVIKVTDIFKGDLPPKSGGELLAATLKGHETLPTRQLVFKGIVNEPTIVAYKNGENAANSVLGKTGASALEAMGLKAKSYRFEENRGKLDVVIDVE